MADVLVIEDMSGVQHSIKSMLRRAGHQVTVADNGAAGLKALQERKFDLVITDMLMPEVDGMEVLGRLAEMPSRPLVIAMSGGGSGIAQEASLNAARLKADAFLEKPFDRTELLSTVTELLARVAA